MSPSWRGETTVTVATSRDPETRKLVRDSLALIVESERVLQRLEDHVNLLQTFVDIEKDQDAEASEQ